MLLVNTAKIRICTFICETTLRETVKHSMFHVELVSRVDTCYHSAMKHRAYKYRIYPDDDQQKQLSVEFGNARYIWNKALAIKNRVYSKYGKNITAYTLSSLITRAKKKSRYEFLKKSYARCATQKLIDLDKAFASFFSGHKKYPKFKRKNGRQSIRYQFEAKNIHYNFRAGEILCIPKIGYVKIKWSRLPKDIPKMITVSRDASNRYFASVSVTEEINHLPIKSNQVGLDFGLKDIATVSTGEKIKAPKILRKNERKLKILSRRLSRKKTGSNRRDKCRKKLAKHHAYISDSRNDFIHKLTSKIVNENQVIAIEDLSIKNMMLNRRLSKSFADASLYEIRRQLEYKSEWYGRELRIIDRYAPSSKRCNQCANIYKNLTLKERSWRCSTCGRDNDRDINAAENILFYAMNDEKTTVRATESKAR
jgi:putative transposase